MPKENRGKHRGGKKTGKAPSEEEMEGLTLIILNN